MIRKAVAQATAFFLFFIFYSLLFSDKNVSSGDGARVYQCLGFYT